MTNHKVTRIENGRLEICCYDKGYGTIYFVEESEKICRICGKNINE